jgi:hypothetical protein
MQKRTCIVFAERHLSSLVTTKQAAVWPLLSHLIKSSCRGRLLERSVLISRVRLQAARSATLLDIGLPGYSSRNSA